MRSSPKWQFIAALTLAGLLSVYATFSSVTGLLWSGFLLHKPPAPFILLFLVPLLALPLFTFAAARSKLAAYCLWALGPAYSLAMFQISAEKFTGSLQHYLGLLLACIVDRMAIVLWAAAWLAHFGTKIYAAPDKEHAPMMGS